MKAIAASANDISPSPPPPAPSDHRRHVKTMPEQIADDVVVAILSGDYRSGERLIEQSLAARYGVSRGPVREALRILVQRGLAVLYPRRGAYVTELSPNALVDLFNIRAVLVGLAVRYYALLADRAAVDLMVASVERLATCTRGETSDLDEFLREIGRVNNVIARHCGSDVVGRLIEQQANESAWSSLWQSGRLDFESHERRSKFAAMYRELAAAIAAGEASRAEDLMRAMLMDSCRHASGRLALQRAEPVDPRRLSL